MQIMRLDNWFELVFVWALTGKQGRVFGVPITGKCGGPTAWQLYTGMCLSTPSFIGLSDDISFTVIYVANEPIPEPKPLLSYDSFE